MSLNDLSKKELLEILEYMDRGKTKEEALSLLLTEDVKNLVCMAHILFCNDKPCNFEKEEMVDGTWQASNHIKWRAFTEVLLNTCDCEPKVLQEAIVQVLKLTTIKKDVLFAMQHVLSVYLYPTILSDQSPND
jgi:hypothetical protein